MEEGKGPSTARRSTVSSIRFVTFNVFIYLVCLTGLYLFSPLKFTDNRKNAAIESIVEISSTDPELVWRVVSRGNHITDKFDAH